MAGADPYLSFAARYDAFRTDAPGRRAFFERLFVRHHVRRVLDCACGTGDDLLLFRSLGLRVEGSDLSDAMLALAGAKLADTNAEIPLVRADFRDLPEQFADSFDAVVCLSTSLPHLLDEAEILRALASMHDALRENGILVLDQGMTDRQWAERPRFMPAVNTSALCRLMAIDYAEDTFTVHVIDFADEGLERAFHHDAFVYRRLLRDDYERLLLQSGFREATFYGGFEFETYSKAASRRLIVVAER
jgi:glycine/sarcosine N-methyltransferase